MLTEEQKIIKENIHWTRKLILNKKDTILRLRRELLRYEKELKDEEESLKQLMHKTRKKK